MGELGGDVGGMFGGAADVGRRSGGGWGRGAGGDGLMESEAYLAGLPTMRNSQAHAGLVGVRSYE